MSAGQSGETIGRSLQPPGNSKVPSSLHAFAHPKLASVGLTGHTRRAWLPRWSMGEYSTACLQTYHVPAYGLHDGGRVLECSFELARMFGYGQPQALIGRDTIGFVDPGHRDAAVQAALTEPGSPIRTRGIRADGTSFGIEISSSKVQYKGGVARLFMVRDTSPLAMVVDDDDVVKNLIAALMRMVGYQACSYNRPEKAIQTFEPGMVSVLLTDIQMPGHTGISLAAQLREKDPDLPVIFVSGFAETTPVQADEKTRFIGKPFGAEDLKRALGELPERARSELS